MFGKEKQMTKYSYTNNIVRLEFIKCLSFKILPKTYNGIDTYIGTNNIFFQDSIFNYLHHILFI
jgi:hypothetical protein